METIVDEHILHALIKKLVYHVTLLADTISLQFYGSETSKSTVQIGMTSQGHYIYLKGPFFELLRQIKN